MGAVGPEICVLVPPKRAAKKLIKMAPYKPALGPKPEETPKANASGKATIPAVIPPKASPLKFENNFFICLFLTYQNLRVRYKVKISCLKFHF
jgi:hypothetical protein